MQHEHVLYDILLKWASTLFRIGYNVWNEKSPHWQFDMFDRKCKEYR